MAYLRPSDIVDAFRTCTIGTGDVVMLHCDALFLAQLPPMSADERYEVFFRALEEVLGQGGTLVLPTFTQSFTKGDTYSVTDTPSIVGALTEHFRTLPGVLRSRDPIFSMAAGGRYKREFAESGIDESFGPDSAFGLLDKHNAWLVCLGCSLDRITFTHYVEQQHGVNYRYLKPFSGMIEENGQTVESTVQYYVRDLDRETSIDLSRLGEYLEERQQIVYSSVGRVRLSAIRAHDFINASMTLLEQAPSALIIEGSRNK